MGCHALLQGIFPTRGSNPHLLCLLCRQAGCSPRKLEVSKQWVLRAYLAQGLAHGRTAVTAIGASAVDGRSGHL